MNNIEWTLWAKEEFYVTVHKIANIIDGGDILYQEKIYTENANLKTVKDYRDYCFFKSNEIIGKVLEKYVKKEIVFSRQENIGGSLSQYYVMHPILKNILNKRLTKGYEAFDQRGININYY